MKGLFITAMASAATAIHANESSLDQSLQLLCRDDIVSWYLSKSSQRSSTVVSIEKNKAARERLETKSIFPPKIYIPPS